MRRNLSHDFDLGAHTAPSFVVDMDLAFQDYVARIADERARRQGLRVIRRPPRYLDRDRAVAVEPDVVIGGRGRQPVALIDAKYKRSEVRADIYQALAYAKAYGLSRVALVYPADGEVTPATHRIWNDSIEVLVRTLPVGNLEHDVRRLERDAANAMTEILGELVALSAGNRVA